MSAITAKASRKMKKYAVLTREPRCFLGSFDFSWEQRKVQDVADRFDNLRIPVAANLRVHGTTPYYGANGIQDYVEGFTHDGEFVLVAEDGANDLKNYPVKCVNGRIWVNNHAHILQGKAGIADNSFLAFAISQSDIESLLVGGGRAKLNAETLMSIEFRLPCLQEQYRIGEYLTQLDHLITLHQRKCVFLFGFFQAFISMIFTASTFSWEQRKAIDIADYSKGNGYSKGDLTDAGTPIILYGRLYTKYQFAISEVDTFAVPRNGAVYSQGNEVIVPASGETAEDIARASAVEKSGVLLGGDLNILRPFDFINPLFLALAISNGEPQKELAKKAQGKSVVHIHNTDIQEVTIAYPSRTEQDRIVSVFRQLDHLITLHQRECISFTARAGRLILTANKKRNTSSWEQRKAIDIADYSKGNGYSKGDLTDAGTPIILYGRLYTKYQFAISEVDTFAVPRNGAVYSQGNEVIVPASGETAEDIARASAVEKSGVLLGGDLNILRPFDFINPLFLALAISNGEPQKELAKKAQGKSVVHIHNTDIQEVTIAYPSRTEQDRIVSVFRQLDHLITLHQRKPFLMKWRTSDANRNQTNRLVL